jgi:hypothetical protein
MIDRNREPSPRDLRVFGLLLVVFFGGFGGYFLWRAGEITTTVIALWSVGGAMSLVFWAVPPLRRTLYRTWMTVAYPIGWTVSHLAVGVLYYLILTPIGLLMRLFGHDPMRRRFDRQAKSYWIARGASPEAARYFRQF